MSTFRDSNGNRVENKNQLIQDHGPGGGWVGFDETKKDIDQTDLQGLMMEIPSLKEGGEFPAIKRNM